MHPGSITTKPLLVLTVYICHIKLLTKVNVSAMRLILEITVLIRSKIKGAELSEERSTIHSENRKTERAIYPVYGLTPVCIVETLGKITKYHY
jgi:hypothetical protein